MVNGLSSLCYRFKQSTVFMRRFTHSQGFGIQSPSAYRFDKEVINAHYPYDTYIDLEQASPRQDWLTLKLARLYSRIAHVIQARQWAPCTYQNDVYCAYVRAGCHTASLADVHEVGEVDKVAIPDASVTAMEDDRWPMCEASVSRAYERPILIVGGIHASKKVKMRWKELANDTRIGVALDFYDCGTIFLDHTKSEQVYITNF